LRTYDIGLDKDGKTVELTPKRIASFFFDILDGKITIPDLTGEFDIGSIVRGETPVAYLRREKASPDPIGSSVKSEEVSLGSTPQVAPPDIPGVQAQEPSLEELTSEATAPAICEDVEPAQTSPEPRCRHCNQPLEEGESFCGDCGKPQD
jgi:hypothetical protein